MTQNTSKKLILVIGATGAQGRAVIDGLLAPSKDGSPSPYTIRALTRDPDGHRAQELTAKGVQCVKGAFDDFPSVAAAMQGVYGAWVNTDGFTVGEEREIYCGMRIFEIAKQTPSVRHYIWSNLDYSLKLGDYNPIYCCEHSNGKGRVGEWMNLQHTEVSETGLTWSMVTTTPYMDMLLIHMFGPLNRRADGTYVFATPVGQGRVPMIALKDIAYFARYTFDHREETSGKELLVTSDLVGWDYLIETFQKVTGQKAVVLHQSLEEWFQNFKGVDGPIANERPLGDGSTTWRRNFSGWWSMWRDGVIKRDMDWIRSINPNPTTLEQWMREVNYTGELSVKMLKNNEDSKSVTVDWDRVAQL